jgi:hypothetical protein
MTFATRDLRGGASSIAMAHPGAIACKEPCP